MAEDLAVVEGDAALRERGHLRVVRDHDDGVALAWRSVRRSATMRLVGLVEVAGGLVGEQDGRVVDEGAGDADALLLAAGKLAGQMLGALAEADFVERGAGFGSSVME